MIRQLYIIHVNYAKFFRNQDVSCFARFFMAMQSFLEKDESKATETNFCCLKSEFCLNHKKIRGSTLHENLSTNTTTHVDRRWTSPLILI